MKEAIPIKPKSLTRIKPRLLAHKELRRPERFGHLLANNRWARAAGLQERVFHCTCDCGNTLYLPYRLLMHRRKTNLGCCQPGCPHSPVSNAVWIDPEAALLYQWRQARAAVPNNLCAEWGGHAYDGVPPDPAGYDKFLTFVWPLIDVENKVWWVHREDERLPLYEYNLSMRDYPDTGIFNPRKILVDLQGSSYSLRELSTTYDLDIQLLLKMWSEITDDEEFIARVIAEAYKGD